MPTTTSGTVLAGGFDPKRHGFRFVNNFPTGVALKRLRTPVGALPIGDASNGLCGGMVYAARDYFESGTAAPSDLTAPASGPLFDYLVDRLFTSFDLPTGVLRYLKLMSPTLPDHETRFSRLGLLPHGRAYAMIRQEWPLIRADIDAGHPSPLGLVTIKSHYPGDLGENHQVLCYGYRLDGDRLELLVYDPNFVRRDPVLGTVADDTVFIGLSLADPDHAALVTYSHRIFGGDQRIWCFFRTRYRR